MIREILGLLSNWRFWWFAFIAFLPLWFGIIGGVVVLIKQKLQENK